jgi:hypothetical protein
VRVLVTPKCKAPSQSAGEINQQTSYVPTATAAAHSLGGMSSSMTATGSWSARPMSTCAFSRGVVPIGPSAFPALSRLHAGSKPSRFCLMVRGLYMTARACRISSLLHSREYDKEALLCAFDLLELSGTAVRKQPLVERKELLGDFLSTVKDGIEFNDYIDGPGPVIFEHARKLGHEGIVAKRKNLPYEFGRSRRWVKVKNPQSPAARRADDGTF